jgi:plasmid maintenance system antidote protein VapI
VGHDLLPTQTGEKPWHPDKWKQRHRLVVSLHMAGYKNNEIAEHLRLHPTTVSIIINDPRARSEMDALSKQVADRITDVTLRMNLYANEALSEIVDEMRSCEKPEIRQKAAFGLLDRAGYSPVKKQIVGHTQLSDDVAHRLDSLLEDEDEIDADYEVVLDEDEEILDED